MSNKNDNKSAAQDVASSSRRRLLKGVGLLGGAFALGGAAGAQAEKTPGAKEEYTPGTVSPDERWGKQPYYGEHQAGILTPQQAAMMLVAFDVLATTKADLERLFRLLDTRFSFLTTGGTAPSVDPKFPSMDSGVMGAEIYPDNLTMTLSAGDSLFDERFGLAPHKPLKLQRMARFPTTPLMRSFATAICCCRSAPITAIPWFTHCATSSSTRRICSACAGVATASFRPTPRAVRAKKRRSTCWASKTVQRTPDRKTSN